MQTVRQPFFDVFLIRPSKYDDDGYVIRYWRAVVPSNSLACLNALTEDVRQRGLLGEVDPRVHIIDEAVTRIPFDLICRLNRKAVGRVLVCLVGVQSNQFCRAADIALALRREGVAVMIGGFHVSGMLAMFPEPSPEIRQLVEAGVTVVAGEVEHRWAELLLAAYASRLEPIYRFLADPPDLAGVPCPAVPKRSLHRFVHKHYGTIDCSRGCPFHCSFCTIINVQGKRTRYRSPECIAAAVRDGFRQSGTNLYFFTDDNFSRNPVWEEIFDALIDLRQNQGVAIEFVIQADVPAYRISGFVEKAARAGCRSVFIGMESLNPRNLQEIGKTQNRVQEYAAAVAGWHQANIRVQVGYIIGLPHDTEQSVREDLDRLIAEVRPDQASFFMLMPLPGSEDHKRMAENGTPLCADYNSFDSCHETMAHPHMKHGAWARSYDQAWRRFYSMENMKAILSRTSPENYWDVFKNFFWYKSGIAVEGAHPMMTGIVRLKDRATRRQCFPPVGRLAHWRRRLLDMAEFAGAALRLTLEMEELWLATRQRSEAECRVTEELAHLGAGIHRGLRMSDLRAAYLRAKTYRSSIEVPSRLGLLWERVSLGPLGRLRRTRHDLAMYWAGLRWQVRHGRINALLRFDEIALHLIREARLVSDFLAALGTSAPGDRRA